MGVDLRLAIADAAVEEPGEEPGEEEDRLPEMAGRPAPQEDVAPRSLELMLPRCLRKRPLLRLRLRLLPPPPLPLLRQCAMLLPPPPTGGVKAAPKLRNLPSLSSPPNQQCQRLLHSNRLSGIQLLRRPLLPRFLRRSPLPLLGRSRA